MFLIFILNILSLVHVKEHCSISSTFTALWCTVFTASWCTVIRIYRLLSYYLSAPNPPSHILFFFMILWLSKYFSFVGCSLLSFASRRHQRDTYIGRGKGLVLLAALSVSSQPRYCTWQQQFVLAAVVSRFFSPHSQNQHYCHSSKIPAPASTEVQLHGGPLRIWFISTSWRATSSPTPEPQLHRLLQPPSSF